MSLREEIKKEMKTVEEIKSEKEKLEEKILNNRKSEVIRLFKEHIIEKSRNGVAGNSISSTFVFGNELNVEEEWVKSLLKKVFIGGYNYIYHFKITDDDMLEFREIEKFAYKENISIKLYIARYDSLKCDAKELYEISKNWEVPSDKSIKYAKFKFAIKYKINI